MHTIWRFLYSSSHQEISRAARLLHDRYSQHMWRPCGGCLCRYPPLPPPHPLCGITSPKGRITYWFTSEWIPQGDQLCPSGLHGPRGGLAWCFILPARQELWSSFGLEEQREGDREPGRASHSGWSEHRVTIKTLSQETRRGILPRHLVDTHWRKRRASSSSSARKQGQQRFRDLWTPVIGFTYKDQSFVGISMIPV